MHRWWRSCELTKLMLSEIYFNGNHRLEEERGRMTVLFCSWGNTVEGGTEEALTLARQFSGETGQDFTWLVVGGISSVITEMAANFGVQILDHIEDPKLSNYGPDALVEALAQYCRATDPQTILFNQSASVRLIAPRLAGRLAMPVITNAVQLHSSDGVMSVTATAYGGDTRVLYELTERANVISLVTSEVVAEPTEQPSSPEVKSVSVDLSSIEERFKITSAVKSMGPRLEEADIIVSGGRGLGTPENYNTLVKGLAQALGGMHGGSRVIVDEGWIDSTNQVGLTGKITRPSLYIAAGISGASQHMAGCSAAKTIVAINKDKHASIFRYARYGIVADCLEVLPELIKAAKD